MEIHNDKEEKKSIDLTNLVDVSLGKKSVSLHLKKGNQVKIKMRNADEKVLKEWNNLFVSIKLKNRSNREDMKEMREKICTDLQELIEKQFLPSKNVGVPKITRFKMVPLNESEEQKKDLDENLVYLKKNSDVTYFETTNMKQRKKDTLESLHNKKESGVRSIISKNKQKTQKERKSEDLEKEKEKGENGIFSIFKDTKPNKSSLEEFIEDYDQALPDTTFITAKQQLFDKKLDPLRIEEEQDERNLRNLDFQQLGLRLDQIFGQKQKEEIEMNKEKIFISSSSSLEEKETGEGFNYLKDEQSEEEVMLYGRGEIDYRKEEEEMEEQIKEDQKDNNQFCERIEFKSEQMRMEEHPEKIEKSDEFDFKTEEIAYLSEEMKEETRFYKSSSTEEKTDYNFEDFFWNEQFQSSYEFLFKSEDVPQQEILNKQEIMSAIENEFINTSKRIGEVIIDELYLPIEEKTIKPSEVGGIIGKKKFFFFFFFTIFFTFFFN